MKWYIIKSTCIATNRYLIDIINDKININFQLGDGVISIENSTYMFPKTPFQFAVKKYGVKSIKTEILESIDFEYQAFEKYQMLLKKCADSPESYNVHPIAWNYLTGNVYQYDLSRNFVKEWKMYQIRDFYAADPNKMYLIAQSNNKFLSSYWSDEKLSELHYTSKTLLKVFYVYKDKKLLYTLDYETLWKWFHWNKQLIDDSVKNHSILNDPVSGDEFIISNKLYDELPDKRRRQIIRKQFYVYDCRKNLVGVYKGKKPLMRIISCHSWQKIHKICFPNGGWLNNHYLSPKSVEKNSIPDPPKQLNSGVFLIYDKFGNFIEEMMSIEEVWYKYKTAGLKKAEIKRAMWGNKNVGNYIIKYQRI